MRLFLLAVLGLCCGVTIAHAGDTRPSWSWQQRLPITFGLGNMHGQPVSAPSTPTTTPTERLEGFVNELPSFVGAIGSLCTSMRRGLGFDCGRRMVGFTHHFH